MPGRQSKETDRTAERRIRLREIHKVRQDADGLHRRWFNCATADLYVWQDAAGIAAFEFCWDKPRTERVLHWSREQGALHARIDDGEAHALETRSPVFTADGPYDPARAALAFEEVAAAVEPRLYRFVLGRLHLGP